MDAPEIRLSPARILTGISIRTSLANDKTVELWRRFMPGKKEIKNRISEDLLSVQLYDELPDGENFNALTPFTKWAAAEVSAAGNCPQGMDNLVIPEGLYAVFLHIGGPARAAESFTFIYRDWLPSSGFRLELRPTFEVLGEKYSNNSPDSEEEIWIPIGKLPSLQAEDDKGHLS